MDVVVAGLYALLMADNTLTALIPGGVWNLRANDGTPLSLVKLHGLPADFDYTFSGMSSLRFPFMVTAYAEDTDASAGAAKASVIAGHLLRVLNTDALAVAGYEVLLCRPYASLPPDLKRNASGRDEYSEGVLVEVIVTPT